MAKSLLVAEENNVWMENKFFRRDLYMRTIFFSICRLSAVDLCINYRERKKDLWGMDVGSRFVFDRILKIIVSYEEGFEEIYCEYFLVCLNVNSTFATYLCTDAFLMLTKESYRYSCSLRWCWKSFKVNFHFQIFKEKLSKNFERKNWRICMTFKIMQCYKMKFAKSFYYWRKIKFNNFQS